MTTIEKSPAWQALPCGGFISTAFVFQSSDVQNAANAAYVSKSTVDAKYAARSSQKKYTFKTDRERMMYIIGRQALVPKCSGV